MRRPLRSHFLSPYPSPDLKTMEASTQKIIELIETTRTDFRFKYIGGGYFRDRTIETGKKA